MSKKIYAIFKKKNLWKVEIDLKKYDKLKSKNDARSS